MKKTFPQGTTLYEAMAFLMRAGCSEITMVDGNTIHFNTSEGNAKDKEEGED